MLICHNLCPAITKSFNFKAPYFPFKKPDYLMYQTSRI
jgi:hypothetical protein